MKTRNILQARMAALRDIIARDPRPAVRNTARITLGRVQRQAAAADPQKIDRGKQTALEQHKLLIGRRRELLARYNRLTPDEKQFCDVLVTTLPDEAPILNLTPSGSQYESNREWCLFIAAISACLKASIPNR
jgi:hypothetical protein